MLKTLASIATTSLLAAIVWAYLGSEYIDYVHAGTATRFQSLDAIIVFLSHVYRIDKIAAPAIELVFNEWWAHHEEKGQISFGLFQGAVFGLVGGVYLTIWGVGHAFRTFLYRDPIDKTLRALMRVTILTNLTFSLIGLFYVIALNAIGTGGGSSVFAVLSALISVSWSLFVYSGFAWAGYWCVIAGRRISNSLGLPK